MELQEYLLDNNIGTPEIRAFVLDFVLDNFVPKTSIDARINDADTLAFERVMATLSRICYRQTGNSDLGDRLVTELRAELKGDFAAAPPPFFV